MALSDANRDCPALVIRLLMIGWVALTGGWSYCVSLLYLPSFQILMS